jgi:hypothetical protein
MTSQRQSAGLPAALSAAFPWERSRRASAVAPTQSPEETDAD